MAKFNQAPKIFAKTNKKGVPINALIVSMLFGMAAVLADFFAGFVPVDVYTNMVATNIKSFATAGFTDYKAHVAGNANVPGSIMEKEDDLKAADEMAAWLIG